MNIDQNTSIWLHNKLSNDEGNWASTNVVSQLTCDLLKSIYDCFQRLEVKIKIKLLLSFLEIPLRNMAVLQEGLTDIIHLADTDTNEWVKVAANIVKDYPTMQVIETNLTEVVPSFQETLHVVNNATKDSSVPYSISTLPMECPYLNQTSLNHMCGTQPVVGKHFTLRRKPKSVALRAKINNKWASDATNQRRSSLTVSTPSTTKSQPKKSTPHQLNKINAVSTPKTLLKQASHKKTKMLDIADQPLGVKEQKKRKKQAALDAQQEKKKEKQKAKDEDENQMKAEPASDAEQETASEEPPEEVTTPSTTTTPQPTPSYALIPGTLPDPPAPSIGTPPKLTPFNPPHSQEMMRQESTDAPSSPQSIQREIQMRVREQEMWMHQQRLAAQQHLFPQYPPRPMSMMPPGMNLRHGMNPLPPHLLPQPQLPQQKKGLSLTKEQMMAAQEMFRSANRVTRAEKTLILGFMAGARDNPFPQQGPIITIKLSEATEMSNQTEGSPQRMVVEMLFEMNYDTGHWRRLKRTRVLQNN